MKTNLLVILTSIFMFVSLNALANTTMTKVTISGEPVTVTKSGNYYVLPGTGTYTTTSDYYYLTLDGNKQVCYRDIRSDLATIDPVNMELKIGNDIVTVHCYTYSPDYFIVK